MTMKLKPILGAAAAATLLAQSSSADLVPGVTAISSFSTATSNRTPLSAVDGSGLNAPATPGVPSAWTHQGGTGTFGGDWNWLAFARSTDPLPGVDNHWIAFDLGAAIELDSMNVFNFGVASGGNNARGTNQADIYYRSDSFGTNSDNNHTAFDSTGWTLLGTAGTQSFAIGPNDGSFQGATNVPLGGITARYFAIDINSSHGDSNFVGLGEVQFFDSNVTDPVLSQLGEDPGPPVISADLNFGSGVASGATTRSLRFENVGPTQDIEISAVNILNDADGVFMVSEIRDFLGDPVALPLTLNPFDTIDIEVTFDPGGMAGDFTADLEIDTDEDTVDNPQDQLLPISATEFAPGSKLTSNPNFTFEATPYNSGWTTQLTSLGGGIAPGSGQSTLLDPAGEGYLIHGFTPLSDFQISYYFAVKPIPGGAMDGGSNILFSVRIPPFDRSITIAYFPAGVGGSGTPGWYTLARHDLGPPARAGHRLSLHRRRRGWQPR